MRYLTAAAKAVSLEQELDSCKASQHGSPAREEPSSIGASASARAGAGTAGSSAVGELRGERDWGSHSAAVSPVQETGTRTSGTAVEWQRRLAQLQEDIDAATVRATAAEARVSAVTI
jgi:hypothetical protein